MDKMIYGLGAVQASNALSIDRAYVEKQQTYAQCAPPAPVTTVYELLNVAHEQLGVLQNAVGCLEERLQMVLVGEFGAEGQIAQGVGTSEPQAVALVRALIDRVIATSRRLDDITSRVRA